MDNNALSDEEALNLYGDRENNTLLKPKPKINPEMREELRKPFPDEAIKVHESKSYLSTINAMYIIERLNDVFSPGRWTLKHEVVNSDHDYILLKGQLIIYDYDCHIPIQFGGHKTSGGNTELADGYKSAVTDLISKSASYLEVGIDVFKGNHKPLNNEVKKTNQVLPPVVERELTESEVESKKWNGKIYKGGVVFIDNVRIKPPQTQIDRLKKHKKYKGE